MFAYIQRKKRNKRLSKGKKCLKRGVEKEVTTINVYSKEAERALIDLRGNPRA
jgi:hypothetical protein